MVLEHYCELCGSPNEHLVWDETCWGAPRLVGSVLQEQEPTAAFLAATGLLLGRVSPDRLSSRGVVLRGGLFSQQTATSKPIFIARAGFEGELPSMRFIKI